MQTIAVGHTGIRTTPIGMGCARLGSMLTPLSAAECVDLVSLAYELGIRHFDTAAAYGQGDSERHIGAALWKKRDRVCIATKAGHRPTLKQQALSPLKRPIQFLMRKRGSSIAFGGHRTLGERNRNSAFAGPPQCFDPQFLEQSLDASLQRLRTDYVDIFYLHAPPIAVLHDPAIHDLAVRLKTCGKVRAFGVYCDDPSLARSALRMPAADVIEFAARPDANDPLLSKALSSDKACVLKHLARPAAISGHYSEHLTRALEAALRLSPRTPFIIGTVNAAHLRENVRLFATVAGALASENRPEEAAA